MAEKISTDSVKSEKNNDPILGMVIIGNLVTKICSGSVTQADILSAMGQVIYWFSLLSEEWRRKAFWLFDKLWKKRQVSMSTHTTLPKEIYDAVNFEDA